MTYSLNELYKEIGISKQAVNAYSRRQKKLDISVKDLLIKADNYREEHPGCGVEKLYYTLKPTGLGRDRFIDTFMDLGYRLKRRRNQRKTTVSSSKYYPNLINGLQVDGPNQVWQSDITYIRIKESYYYATFIIDVYSKKIVGHKLSKHMRASANVQALKKAIKENGNPKIHHSDRGAQYTSKAYTGMLKLGGTQISMGLNAQENAYAERINRTIKQEYLEYWKPQSFNQLKRQLNKAVNQYNKRRLHNNINRNTPDGYLKMLEGITNTKRPVVTIFDYNNN